MSYFGIDLGTTNSLIGNAATGFLSDIVPSCANMDTKKAGESEYKNPNARRSFKLSMSMDVGGAVPRLASSYVLKALKEKTAGAAHDVVISVPAFFNDNQRQATYEAAEMAGLNVVGLINEPTAAAAYIARNEKSLFVVMDLGGGTYDVSIVDSRYGPYMVQASDGIIPCGGNNLDELLRSYIAKQAKLPVFLMDDDERELFLIKCAEYKKEISTNYPNDTYIDLSPYHGPSKFKVPSADYKVLVSMAFKKTVDKTKELIDKTIPGEEYKLLLVGGSTKDPYYQHMVTELLNHDIEPLTYDPDRVVAQGAAYCAMLKEQGKFELEVHDVVKALSYDNADGTCTQLVPPNSSIPLSKKSMAVNSEECDTLVLTLYQGESIFAEKNEPIGTLRYNYGRTMAPKEGLVYISIDIDDKGIITFSCAEPMHAPVSIKLER